MKKNEMLISNKTRAMIISFMILYLIGSLFKVMVQVATIFLGFILIYSLIYFVEKFLDCRDIKIKNIHRKKTKSQDKMFNKHITLHDYKT